LYNKVRLFTKFTFLKFTTIAWIYDSDIRQLARHRENTKMGQNYSEIMQRMQVQKRKGRECVFPSLLRNK